MLHLGILLLLVSTCLGHQTYTTTIRPYVTNVADSATENSYETLCSRTHTNTAFVGAQPYSKMVLNSAGDCFKTCLEGYPRCVAVVFYNLHEGDLRNVCYKFDKNSAHEDVALVPERPVHENDTIRCLEVVPDCYDFNPVPPLSSEYVQSTDIVSESQRVETSSSLTAASHTLRTAEQNWGDWSRCTPRAPMQIRTMPCDYGRLINRKKCSYGSMYPYYRQQPIIIINIPYPPVGYHHPECQTTEYNQIMSQHVQQMRQICCVRPEYPTPTPTGTRETYEPTPSYVLPTCRQVCVPQPQEQPLMDVDEDELGGKEVIEDIGTVPESVWLQWTEWSMCSTSCDFGTQQRSRSCSAGRGYCLGESFASRMCEGLEPCRTWSEWAMWSNCRASCGEGERTRTRFCYLGLGRCGGKDVDVEQCLAPPCAEWMEWGQWSGCSATCDFAEKTRERICSSSVPGACQGESIETTECEVEPCALWTNWQEWGACSATCGIGEQRRSRICEGGYGRCYGPGDEMRDCVPMLPDCAEWMHWGEWTMCSASCGFGFQKRTRVCYPDGGFCPGESYELLQCREADCAHWTEWGGWSFCSRTCDEGVMVNTRTCIDGEYCEGSPTQQQSCNLQPCAEWEPWGYWSPCSSTCGYGTQTRSRECATGYCTGPKSEERECPAAEQPQCPTWETWSEWSQCPVTCGNGGQQQRYRNCRNGPSRECQGEDHQQRSCGNEIPCAHWAPWGAWVHCSASCGIGDTSRRRECVTDGNYPTSGCFGEASEMAQCLDKPCCEWGHWAPWTQCDRMCGNGRRNRQRDCKGDNPRCCHGKPTEVMDCNMGPCPTPAITHTIKRTKLQRKNVTIGTTYIQPQQMPCIPYPECVPQPINATNCRWTQWCSWSPCPTTCDYGTTRRHRYCVGDNSCICGGPSLEKSNCVSSEQCRKKK